MPARRSPIPALDDAGPDGEVERARFEYVEPDARTVEGDVIDVHLRSR